MSIGLDLGARAFRSLRRGNNRLIGRACRSGYAILPDVPAQRELLQRAAISYAQCEDNLVLLGDSAAEFSRTFHAPCLDLLPQGCIPREDPIARQIAAILVESLLPTPQTEGEICCFTTPGRVRGLQAVGADPAEFFTRVIKLSGYVPRRLNAGMAIVLADLVHEGFTGIGLTLGAAVCEVSLAHCGVEVAHCTLPRGGRWIDEQLALEGQSYCSDVFGNKRLDLDHASRKKERAAGGDAEASAEERQRLLALYRDLVTGIAETMKREFARALRLHDVPQPLSLVCTGGATELPGFCELLQRQLEVAEFPIRLRDVRMAREESQFTVARGCLVHAELESQAAPEFTKLAG